MSEYPTRHPELDIVIPELDIVVSKHGADVLAQALRAGRVSFEEARRSMLAAFGYTDPYQPSPAYESMLLTAGYEAEIRCE